MMRNLAWKPIVLALALALLLVGCANTLINVPTPETPRERLAALEISYQEINRSIQDLVAAGTLHGTAAPQVATFLEAATITLRAARAGVDGPEGTNLLNAANQALIALTARLRAEESS